MKTSLSIMLIISAILFSFTSNAGEIFKITLIRADAGSLLPLLNETKAIRKEKAGDLIIMRHSQGEQWDVMLLELAQADNVIMQHNLATPIAYQHSFLATADQPWEKIKKDALINDLYHIEMFEAEPMKLNELIEQRQMENSYYHATERAGNVIFTTIFGHDMDVFTLGFYKDLITFATDPDLSDEVFEKAATDAGFESRGTIGLYLRELISSHRDTLATRVN